MLKVLFADFQNTIFWFPEFVSSNAWHVTQVMYLPLKLLRANVYYSAIGSLYRHVVCNVLVSCKANGDRNQLGVGVARQ